MTSGLQFFLSQVNSLTVCGAQVVLSNLLQMASFKKWKRVRPFLLLFLSSTLFPSNQFPKPSETLKSNQRFKCPTFFTRPCFKSFYAARDLRKSERASERQRYFKTVAISLALLVAAASLRRKLFIGSDQQGESNMRDSMT